MRTAKSRKALDPECLFRKAEVCEEKGDFETAFQHLLMAAKLGDAGSQLNLGNFYSRGKGVKRDRERAAYWYRKAYQNGESCGARNLAIDRKNEGNMRSAVNWFKKAIAKHDGEAFVGLAKIYGARPGGEKTAIALLKRAIQLGRDQISDAAKEEAGSLLERLQARKGQIARLKTV